MKSQIKVGNETLTKGELVLRLISIHPKMLPTELQKKLRKDHHTEVGISYIRIVRAQFLKKSGLPPAFRGKPPISPIILKARAETANPDLHTTPKPSTPPTIPNVEVILAPDKASLAKNNYPSVTNIATVIRTLKQAITLLGGKSQVTEILEVL